MTESEKKLVSIDICGRLPYGVKVKIFDNDILRYDTEHGVLYGKENMDNDDFVIKCHNDSWVISCENFKPYLRPLSSMSQKEIEEYSKFSYYGAFGIMDEDFTKTVGVPSFEKMDYLDSHHFDYRGLIDKGLALQAPEGMYNLA